MKLPKLEKHQRYWWRVDAEKADGSVTKGELWSFVTGTLVGWWTFDQVENEIVSDSSGNGLNGKLVGDARIVSDPVRGNVLSFDGDGDCVEIPNIGESSEVTYAVWVKQDVINRGRISLIDDKKWISGSVHFELVDGHLKVGISEVIEPGGDLIAPHPVPAKEWHHLSMVKSETELVLYVDSEPVVQRELTKSDPVGLLGASIGAFKGDKLRHRYFKGQMDDVRIYSYALSKAEVKDLYAGRGPGPNERP